MLLSFILILCVIFKNYCCVTFYKPFIVVPISVNSKDIYKKKRGFSKVKDKKITQ